jgi:hypothetical protein
VGLLEQQLQQRRVGALPIAASDPRWTLRIDGVDRERERAHESLFALTDGRLGTRGSVLGSDRASAPAVVLAGVYSGLGERSELARAPLWTRLSLPTPCGRLARTLDLHSGLLTQEAPGRLRALQYSSLAEPGLAGLRAFVDEPVFEPGPPLQCSPSADAQTAVDGDQTRIAVTDGQVEVASVQSITRGADETAAERIVAYARTGDPGTPVRERLERAHAAGHERLLIDHRGTWANRWEQADVRIDGDPELQLAARLALYHLIGSAADDGEAAVGARGLTGRGYRGHVFWDSDVFVLPFLAATHPAAARSILGYRVRRIPPPKQPPVRPAVPARALRGSPQLPAKMSRRARRRIAPATRSRSTPGSARSTSSPTLPGRPAAIWTGPATQPFAKARGGNCLSRRPAIGLRALNATAMARAISAA